MPGYEPVPVGCFIEEERTHQAGRFREKFVSELDYARRSRKARDRGESFFQISDTVLPQLPAANSDVQLDGLEVFARDHAGPNLDPIVAKRWR